MPLLSSFFKAYEADILVALILIVLGLGAWEIHRQRQIGAEQTIAADAAATAKVHAQVLKDEAALQARADKAERERDAITQALDAYAASHPVGSVRLCKPSTGSAGMPKGSDAGSGTAGASTGPATVPEVLGGSEGPDIGPDLDAILSAAETVDGLYQAAQQR